MRVFIGLTDVASYFAGLKTGFNEIGVDSVFVNFRNYNGLRQAQNNEPNWLLRLTRQIVLSQSEQAPKNRILLGQRYLIRFILRLFVFIWAIFACDVFIFASRISFWGLYDLPLLKFLGKRIFFVFTGSDSRPPYLNGALVAKQSSASIQDCIKLTRHMKREIQWVEKYADACINHPPSAHFHEKPFVNYALIGHSVFGVSQSVAQKAEKSDTVRIVHAPTRPEQKGTPQIRAAIEALREKGHKIEFIELINRPNSDVLLELSKSDFAIDELYSDISLAVFGTEAAYFAKPALVGGYAQKELQSISSLNGLPVDLYVRPEKLQETIEKLILDQAYRDACGIKAREFVATQWTPKDVATRFLQIIQDDFPADWLINPQRIEYLHGWGLPESRVKEVIALIIQECGKEALCLSDKPELENRFLSFALIDR